MKISILCSSTQHPVYNMLVSWQKEHEQHHRVDLVQSKNQLSGGDILFLISCNELITREVRDRYATTLVIHASDLPKGRGWSPHIWQIVEGRNCICVTLLEAEDKVDSGAIWAQRELRLEGHELYDEINDKLFEIERQLMNFAVAHFQTIVPVPQRQEPPSYYSKRTPEDSRIDPNKSIAEQFDLLRVADPTRFPSFFDMRGHRYRISIEKMNTSGAAES